MYINDGSKAIKNNNSIDIKLLYEFLLKNALDEELVELAKILKCHRFKKRDVFVWYIVKRLYSCYQTPLGYRLKNPTLDDMEDKIVKKLKLRKLQGEGWQKLYILSVNIFENILKSMPKDEKEKLLKEMWGKMTPEDKDQMYEKFQLADYTTFIHTNEMLVAHVVGIHLANEMAIYTANTIIRINFGTELTLIASRILTRSASALLGPVGWALIAVSINDLMGTNFKRVVPALLIINIINMRVNNEISKSIPCLSPLDIQEKL